MDRVGWAEEELPREDAAVELLRYIFDTILWENDGGAGLVLVPGSRGEVGRGVVDGVRSSVSKLVSQSRGVIGRGIP